MPRAKPSAENIDEILLADSETAPGSQSVESEVLAEFNQADDQDVWLVNVARYLKANAPEEFCFNCVPTDFPIVARIQEEFGAGMYIVRARRNGRIVRSFRYAIAEPKTKPVDKVTSELGTMAAAFTSALERQGQQIERMMGELKRPATEPTSLSELVKTLTGLRELIPQPVAAPALDPTTLLSIFKMGMDMASDRPAQDSGGLLGFAERLLNSPFFAKLSEGMTANPPPTAQAPRPIITAPQPGQEGDATRPAPTADENQQRQAALENFMRQQIMYLMGRAHQWQQSGQTKSHPDLYAEWVIDNIPEDILRPILDLPDPFAALLVYVPEAAVHRAWFVQLIATVNDELTAEGEAEDIANRPNGAAPQNVSSAPGPTSSVHT